MSVEHIQLILHILHDLLYSLDRNMTRDELEGVSTSFGVQDDEIDLVVFEVLSGLQTFDEGAKDIKRILDMGEIT